MFPSHDPRAASIISPDAEGEVIEIEELVVANTSASNTTFSVYHDEDGTTYDENTALFHDTSIDANTTVQIQCKWTLRNPSGNFAIESGANNAITFTVYGERRN